MKMPSLFAFALVAAATSIPAQTGGDSAYLGIFAETKSTKIVGMKMRAMPKLPPGFKLPAAAKAMFSGPTRVLTVRLWSPSIAPDNATASIVPPAGLLQGDKLDLALFRPQPVSASGGGGNQGTTSSSSDSNFTIKIYWGSSNSVQSGQPKVFSMSSMTPQQQMEMGKHVQAMNPQASANYAYKDGWTTAYWPTADQPGDISDSANLQGTYTLNTSYTGSVSIDAPSDLNFLAPIELTSPDLSTKPNMDNSLPFQWNPIPNVLGQFAAMFGFEKASNTVIIWTSSQVYADQLVSDMGYLSMADVNDMVQKTIFMPGSATSVTVPAGIFKDCDAAFLSMVGYGPGTAKDGAQPVPRIQTKTTLSAIFPIKKGGRGGPGGDGGR